MALVNRSFSVNVTPGMMPPIVHVSEYDVGRAYTISILDEQGNMFTIPSGTTASIEGTLNGSVGFTQSATVSNNQVSFTLSESMTAYSGKAWCKIKLTQNSQPIQTCAFILAVDRAGVESDTVIGAPGFEEQIQDAVDDYLDNHGGGVLPAGGQNGQALVSDGQGGAVWGVKPFQLPSGGETGQALLSDGNGGAVWGQAQGSGTGLTDDVKQALLDCFENVAWINDQGQTYYQALREAFGYEPEPEPEPDQALYPLANGSYTFSSSGETVTISDGNHVEIDIVGSGSGKFICLSDLISNAASSNTSSNGGAVNNRSNTLFNIPAGAVCVFEIKNLNLGIDELLSRHDGQGGQFLVAMRTTGSNQNVCDPVGYILGGTERTSVSFTNGSQSSVSCVFVYLQYEKQNISITFDVSLTVNGQKWI